MYSCKPNQNNYISLIKIIFKRYLLFIKYEKYNLPLVISYLTANKCRKVPFLANFCNNNVDICFCNRNININTK